MNLLESTDESSRDVFFASFNQNCTALSVGSKQVFSLYSLDNVNEFNVFQGIVGADVRIIEGHFISPLAAVVTVSAPRILNMIHVYNQYEVRRYRYPNTILAVKLSQSRIVVCLERSLYIRSLRNDNAENKISDVPPNPLGLCILSQNIENNLLAYPGSSSSGEVAIYDTINNRPMGMIAAHENPLAAMAFNATATKIATASDKGTVIRVFDAIEKTKLHEFRRGFTTCARIYSLCFSQDSNYLSSSSNRDTVHIFRLDNMREKDFAGEPEGLIGFLTNVIVGLLPQWRTAPTSMLCSDRAFATVRLPFSGIRNICALAEIQGSLRVLIVSGERILYMYNVDSINGGECVLEHKYNLLELQNSVSENRAVRFFGVAGRIQHQEDWEVINPAEE